MSVSATVPAGIHEKPNGPKMIFLQSQKMDQMTLASLKLPEELPKEILDMKPTRATLYYGCEPLLQVERISEIHQF